MRLATSTYSSGIAQEIANTSLIKDNQATDTIAGVYGAGTSRSVQNTDNPVVRENDMSTAELGIKFWSGSTGKYMDNPTYNVTTPITGGTAVVVND